MGYIDVSDPHRGVASRHVLALAMMLELANPKGSDSLKKPPLWVL
jgi:hypothetical protein